MTSEKQWRIGELAKQLGISVRTLRHYETMGLLNPLAKAKNGYRLYGKNELSALQLILSLKELGMSLDEIKTTVSKPSFQPSEVMQKTIAHNESRINMLQNMNTSLKNILSRNGSVSPEEFIFLIQMGRMINKHYTPDEMDFFAKRREEVGDKRIREVEQNAWPELIAKVRAEMEKGTDSKDVKVRELARQWKGLVEEFTGGNPKIAARVKELYDKNMGAMPAHPGMPTPEMMEFVNKALLE